MNCPSQHRDANLKGLGFRLDSIVLILVLAEGILLVEYACNLTLLLSMIREMDKSIMLSGLVLGIKD